MVGNKPEANQYQIGTAVTGTGFAICCLLQMPRTLFIQTTAKTTELHLSFGINTDNMKMLLLALMLVLSTAYGKSLFYFCTLNVMLKVVSIVIVTLC